MSVIVKSVFTITALRRVYNSAHTDDIVGDMLPSDVAYQIDEGDWLGAMEVTSQEVVPSEQVEAECLALGNDGNFFNSEE